MPQPVFTAGYAQMTPQRLQSIVEALGAAVVDVRYRAASRNPAWSKSRLLARLGERRYVHLPAWGNVNYRSGGAIQIADYAAGLRSIQTLQHTTANAPLVLLCVCANAVTCHRTTVGDMLRADGYEVVELDEAKQQTILHSSPGQLPLWE